MGTTAQVAERGIDRWAKDTVKAAELPGEISYDTLEGQRVTVYKPFPRQGEFCELLNEKRYRLFGGSAGPGKTLTLLMQAALVSNCKDEGKGLATLCLRRTVPQLEASFIREFRKHVPRELYQSYNEQKKTVLWWNGATTRFGSMQHEKDVWDYQGNEYARIFWDELCQFTIKQWETLSIWNRTTIAGVPVGMDGAANPIGPGAIWVKHLFVDKKPAPGMERPEKYNPNQYAFVPARVTDNPVYANDAEYLATLDALPKALRDAMLLGLWTLAAGAYFDIWDPAEMTLRPEEIGRQEWWPHWVSLDWGFEHEAAVHRWTTGPDGRVYTYGETVVRHTDPEPLAELMIEAMTDPEGRRIKPEAVYVGPDAFAHRTSAHSIAEQMNVAFERAGWPTCSPADDDRVGGWQLMYSMLRTGQWRIATTCPRLIEVLPVLVRDEKHVEDVQKMAGDDPADGARYGLYSKFKAHRPPFAQQVMERVTSTDPAMRMIQRMRAEAALRKEAAPFHPRRSASLGWSRRKFSGWRN